MNMRRAVLCVALPVLVFSTRVSAQDSDTPSDEKTLLKDEVNIDTQEKQANAALKDVKLDHHSLNKAKAALMRAEKVLNSAADDFSVSTNIKFAKDMAKVKKDAEKTEEDEALAKSLKGEATYQKATGAIEATENRLSIDADSAASREGKLNKKIQADSEATRKAADELIKEIKAAQARVAAARAKFEAQLKKINSK